ncbi:MAG: FG-GAP repeat protein [Nanoarchaeota archaeon]|nr:FG-GAP repeat protein [Nanoarchaeota archaeon]
MGRGGIIKKLITIFLSAIFLLSILLVVAVTPTDRVLERDNLAVVQMAVFNGTSPGLFGDSYMTTNDFNNDGYLDLVIGANGKNLSGGALNFWGQVYLFYGSSAGFHSMTTDNANITLNGTSPGRFGSFLTSADLNNDTYIDLVVGSYVKNTSGGPMGTFNIGQISIFYGSSDGLHPYTSDQANVTINGTSLSGFGTALMIDDINNDNINDLVVSAFVKNLSGGINDDVGQAYVFYGASNGSGLNSGTSDDANITLNGTSPGRFGSDIVVADFNNDNYNDLAVSAYRKNLSGGALGREGQISIFYGTSNGLVGYTATQANVTINATSESYLGYGMFAQDVNNDGYVDLITSSFAKNLSYGIRDYTGQIKIFYANANGLWSCNEDSANVTINGTSPGYLSYIIKLADINKDNRSDLIVGAQYKNLSGGATDETGQLYIFYASQTGFRSSTTNDANITLNGSQQFLHYGAYFITGDFNNDSLNELVVTASYSNLSGSADTYTGSVYVYSFNFKPNNHTAILAQSWNEDTSITLNLSLYFNDTNNDELNYTWDVGANIGVSINETTNIVTLTPTANWYGARTIIFYANDSYNSLRASNNVTLTVVNVEDCGDGTCESSETCSSCQADCGFCVASSGPSSLPKAKHIVAKINANEKTEFNLGDNTIVKKVNVKANKDLDNVQIEVKEKASVTNEYSKKVYKYFEIITYQITDDDIAEAEIEFDVEKTWLENNSEAANILLLRYKESWNELETSLVSEDDNKYYFKAKTPGFSDFAISFKEAEVVEEQEEVVKEVVKEAVEEAVEEVIEEPVEEKSYTLWYVLGAFILLGIIGLVVFLILRKKE